MAYINGKEVLFSAQVILPERPDLQRKIAELESRINNNSVLSICKLNQMILGKELQYSVHETKL